MKALFGSLSLCIALLVVITAPGCQVEVQEALPYTCTSDEDCAGDGFTCIMDPGRPSFCCKRATEVCNGLDDDCDGVVDEIDGESCYEGPEGTRGVGACRAGRPACGEARCVDQVLPAAADTCNGVDDNCDGTVDEGFDLQNDSANCGACGRTCAAEQTCRLGQCVRRLESSCSDGADNDGDTLIDCADDECLTFACGEGKACQADKTCGEALCGNGVNDDGDAQTDCADPDCDNKSCGTGCVCTGGALTETNCNDGVDNDKKDGADCADPDCGNACGAGCTCQGTTRLETACADGLDNNTDGKTDCVAGSEDANCVSGTCGTGCTLTNCARVETLCDDGLDNDGENGADCADPDCDAKSCNTAGGCTCTGGAEKETACGDGKTNDDDTAADCLDSDCNGQACNAAQGGCICQGTTFKETNCQDLLDNDGNNGADCADQVDCPAGTRCLITAGTTNFGTCQNNRSCK